MNRVQALIMPLIQFYYEHVLVDDDDGSEDAEDDIDDEVVAAMCLVHVKKRKTKPIRIINYVERTVPNLSKQQFQMHFRVTYEAYQALEQIMGPQLRRTSRVGRWRIPVKKQLLAVIWLLATPDSYRSVGERFDLAKAALWVSFRRVITVLCKLAPQLIMWPSEEQRQNIANQFFHKARMPHVVGAIDGTFIPIKAPQHDAEVYVTRKCNNAITLQAVCDAALVFTDVYVGWPGSVSDSRIFKNSVLYVDIRQRHYQFFSAHEYIIGDKVYPTLDWCIPPYFNRGNLNRAQLYFNTVLAKTRQTIERAFALLFGRFRRLKYVDMNRTDLIPNTVLASCVLHNVCLRFPDELIEQYINEGDDAVVGNNEEHYREVEEGQRLQAGRHRKEQLCAFIFAARNRQ